MVRKKLCFFLSVFLWEFINPTQALKKISLTLVIDDSSSMSNDIDAVKRSAQEIFDAVINSNASHIIQDFVLVTMHNTEFTNITIKDRDEYRVAINSLHSSKDPTYSCPLEMSGIELALKLSRPSSLLYVFTDASAKDPEKHEAVKNLAQQKSIQVVFILTDNCKDESNIGNSEVFNQIAQETSGRVYNLYKIENKVLLDYVKSQIDSRQEVAATNISSRTQQFAFEVDSTIKELTIFGPDRRAPMERNQSAIVKITKVNTDTYTVELTGDADDSVWITADTDVHFEHGFSTFTPSSIESTATRPLPGEQSYISVKLTSEHVNDIVLDTVQIIDTDNKVVDEIPLRLSYDKVLYVSNATFIPPTKENSSPLFRIAVKGHDTKSNASILRINMTPLQTQSIDVPVTNKNPDVTVIGEAKINAILNKPLILRCQIKAYPKPYVIWPTNDGTLLHSTLHLVEHPYNYISILSIDKVVSNITYHCFAYNDYGADSKHIRVETMKKKYFNVIKEPKGAEIEIYMNSQVECEVDAYPPAEINWYKNRNTLIEDDNVKISSNRSVLSLKNMQPYMKGKYTCTARNLYNYRVLYFDVQMLEAGKPNDSLLVQNPAHISVSPKMDITTIIYQLTDRDFHLQEGPPKINKTIGEYRIREGENAEIQCPITHVIPKPSIMWYFEDASGTSHELEENEDDETIILTNVTRDSTIVRNYRCNATNDIGSDFHRIKLIIEYPPEIKDDKTTIVETNVGEKQYMDCIVDGQPTPAVKWLLNDTELILSSRHGRAYKSHGFNFYVTENDTGIYICQATNKYGTVNKTIDLRVLRPATIKVPAKTALNVLVGDNLELPCEADGDPKPYLKWDFQSSVLNTIQRHLSHNRNGSLLLKRVQIKDDGYYICQAENSGGSFNITYEVKVLYAPLIKGENKIVIKTDVDKKQHMDCVVSGKPTPNVKWVLNDTELILTTRHEQVNGYGFNFNVTEKDTGIYICQAKNKYGTVNKTIDLRVFRPAPITVSEKKNIAVMVGRDLKLHCKTNGYPNHNIKWTFRSLDPKKEPQVLSSSPDASILKRGTKIEDGGLYICEVNHDGGSFNITYEVEVIAPPMITNRVKGKTFHVVVGDLGLRIPCQATGRPIPQITWKHNQLTVATEDDGTLIIKEISKESAGIYKCEAKNRLGINTRYYKVVVDEYIKPDINPNINNIQIKEGESKSLTCRIYNNSTDRINWFKDGKLVSKSSTSKYPIFYAKLSDAGIYSCRVSNFNKGQTKSFRVIVGNIPTFLYKEKGDIKFEKGELAIMDCTAQGYPELQITWWHEGKLLSVTNMTYMFKMDHSSKGEYICSVKNEFDEIKRRFVITDIAGVKYY